MSEPRVEVDSSGWIEVFQWVLREHSEAQAIQAAAAMQRGVAVHLDSRLTMADSIILAPVHSHGARLYTMDADFRGLEDVELMARR